jgi:hypothetical protein
MENLVRYIIRASFSQERMTYVGEEPNIYQSKDDKAKKVFDALESLAAMCSHVPNKGEQMVRYYGYSYILYISHRAPKSQFQLLIVSFAKFKILPYYLQFWSAPETL